MARCIPCGERATIASGCSRRVVRDQEDTFELAILRRILRQVQTQDPPVRLPRTIVEDILTALEPRPPQTVISRVAVCQRCGARRQTISDEGPTRKGYVVGRRSTWKRKKVAERRRR